MITLRSETIGMWESWSHEDLQWMDQLVPLDFLLDDPISLEEYRLWFAEQAIVYSAVHQGTLDKELPQNRELDLHYHLHRDFILLDLSKSNWFMLPVAVMERYRMWTLCRQPSRI